MRYVVTEPEKKRLVEPADIRTAIRILRLGGSDGEQLTLEITRPFYGDLDAYNEVLASA